MDEDKKKVVMIVVIVVCIGLAAGITYWTNRDSTSSKSAREVVMLCVNPTCGKVTEYSTKEFQKVIDSMSEGDFSPMGAGPTAFVCPHCGKKSCYIAVKCEKCGEVFIPNPEKTRGYLDRCPKCGYSKTEESIKAKNEAKDEARKKARSEATSEE